jgi:hypothetical protein
MHFGSGSSRLINCTIAGNSSLMGKILKYDGRAQESMQISNCIFANDGNEIYPGSIKSTINVSYSNIRGGWAGQGNIDEDPCFVLPGYWDPNGTPTDANDDFWVNGDYHLKTESLCVDAGDPNYAAGPDETDLDGNPRVVYGIIDMGAYEYQNNAPVAVAGPNQVAYAWIDGIAEVTLDASASYDADGDELSYLWTCSINGNPWETNIVAPTIELPVGKYTFELVVNDGTEDSEPNQVEITVVGPVKGLLSISPQVINRKCEQKRIIAMLRLPDGITKDQIDGSYKLTLYPGGIEAVNQCIMPYYANHAKRWFVFAFFDRDEVLESIGGSGFVKVYAVGQLKTGRYFYGSSTIVISNHGRRPKWGNMRDWFHNYHHSHFRRPNK